MTRRILRMLGSRYGIAAILLLIVVMVVAVAQANSDPRPGGRQQDGVVDEPSPGAPDDGYVDPEADPGTSDATDEVLPDQAVSDAEAFARLWVDTEEVSEGVWLDRIRPYVTESTAQQLSGVDPVNVPATEIVGEPMVSGPSVTFDTDQGLLTLTMTEENETWKVSSIDFDHQPN